MGIDKVFTVMQPEAEDKSHSVFLELTAHHSPRSGTPGDLNYCRHPMLISRCAVDSVATNVPKLPAHGGFKSTTRAKRKP